MMVLSRMLSRSLLYMAAPIFAGVTALSLGATTANGIVPEWGREQPKIFAVGHRGAPDFAPENTIPSHEAAIELGATVIEFDVRYTKDGHFVVIHDHTVDRTTNGTGRVSNMTLAEIKALDAGAWMGPQFQGVKVPTLREALRNIKGRAAVDIDFKGGPENSGDILASILDQEGFRDGPLVTVFARSWDYHKLTGVIGKYQLRPHYRGARHLKKAVAEDRIEVVGLRRRAFSFRAARAIEDENVVLFSNVMGFADGPRGFSDSIRAGARFIQTNHLDKLAPYLAERNLLAACIPSRDFGCWEGGQGNEHARRVYVRAEVGS